MAYLLVNIDLFGSQLSSHKDINIYITKLAESKLYTNASSLVEHVRVHANAFGELTNEDAKDAISVITDTNEFLDKMSRIGPLESYTIIKLDMQSVPQPTATR